MKKDEIRKAREGMLDLLHRELTELNQQEAARHAEIAEQFWALRNQARGKHAVQVEALLDAAMILLDEDEDEAPPPAAKTAAPAAKAAEAAPAPAAAASAGPKAGPAAGPRRLPATPAASAAPVADALPSADSVFG